MSKFTPAEYSRGQTGCPLLDAIPARKTIEELKQILQCVPILPKGYRDYPQSKRLEITENIADIYIPLDYAAATYNLLYSGIRSAYRNKTRVSITRNLCQVGKAIERRDPMLISNITTQAENFSVLGEPGMGKTETMTRLLKTMPQVIEHVSYEGMPFEEYQIVYLKIECPANNSPRGVCLQILAAIDELMGTVMSEDTRLTRYNVDNLVMRIAQICIRFHIGCIVIDEIQNILAANSIAPSSNSLLVKFLVELANKTGVCIAFVGTPVIAPFFDAESHLARRTRGPRISPLASILRTMWENVPTLYYEPLTDAKMNLIYKMTGGVLAKMQKLVMMSAQHAIFFGEEKVTEELMKRVARQYNIVPTKPQNKAEVDSPTLIRDRPKKDSALSVPNESCCTAVPKKRRGRPRAQRDACDILVIYKECKEKGWSVEKELASKDLVEGGMM